MSSCASGRITRMLLADICGHGPVFTDMANELRELMKRKVNSIRQESLVREMASQLETAADRGGFASTLVATYFAPTRSLSLCNAGHPPPLLFRQETQQWSVVRAPQPQRVAEAQDLIDHQGEYQHFKTRLDPGDLLMSFSNAFAECQSASGRTLGVEGLLRLVRNSSESDPARLVDEVVETIGGSHADNLQGDDATMFLCQATKTPVTWKDNLLALFRLMGSVSDATNLSSTQ